MEASTSIINCLGQAYCMNFATALNLVFYTFTFFFFIILILYIIKRSR